MLESNERQNSRVNMLWLQTEKTWLTQKQIRYNKKFIIIIHLFVFGSKLTKLNNQILWKLIFFQKIVFESNI